jgi:hypothetical protein
VPVRYVPYMTKFAGTAAVEDPTGNVVAQLVDVELNDDPDECPYETMTPPWYGDMWLEHGDLMIEPLQTNPQCVLKLSNGNVAQARVNSWDLGGRRAQLVGVGQVPFS